MSIDLDIRVGGLAARRVMRAAVADRVGHIAVQEVPVPEPDDDSVLVRVRACGLCGSDLRVLSYGNKRVHFPQILGHEIAGDVVAVGKNVSNLKEGDAIAVGADVPCGECEDCERGRGNNCARNLAMGYQFAGGFAEYVVLNRTVTTFGSVHRLPAGLTYAEATVAEPLACCINGLERCDLRVGETVVVIGAGPIGCLLAALAKVMGAGKVIVAQRSPFRLQAARTFGADIVVHTESESIADRVRAETGGRGADIVVVTAPSPEAQRESLSLVAPRGRILLFAGLPAGADSVALDTNVIHYRECAILGTHGSVPHQNLTALTLLASRRIDARALVTHRFPLADIGEALAVAGRHEGLKIVVEPS